MPEYTNIEYIAFEDEKGNPIEMQIVDEFDHDERHYIALCPIPQPGQDSEDEDMINFFAVLQDENGEETFELIEENRLINTLADLLEERMLSRG